MTKCAAKIDLDVLIDIYESSALPIFILDMADISLIAELNEPTPKLDIIWSNYTGFDMKPDSKFENKAERAQFLNETEVLTEIINSFIKNKFKGGVYYFNLNMDVYAYNIIKPKSGEYIIAERIKKESVSDFLKKPAVRDYTKYIFSKLRDVTWKITIACDEIYELSKKADSLDENIVNCFNIINDCTFNILNEIILPEAISFLYDDSVNSAADSDRIGSEKTICISEVMTNIANDLGKIITDINLNIDIDGGIFARVDKKIFEVIIADMIHKCLNTKNLPETVSIGLKLKSNTLVSIFVKSANSDKSLKINKNYIGKENIAREMLLEYLIKLFCENYNGEFIYSDKPELLEFGINLKIIPDHTFKIAMTNIFENVNNTFSPLNLRLLVYNQNKRYFCNG